MRRIIPGLMIFGAGVFLFSMDALAVTKITPRFSRSTLIEFVEKRIDKQFSAEYLKTLDAVENPFRIVQNQKKEVNASQGEKVLLIDLSAQEVLAAAAQKIKPTGTLMHEGNYRLLVGGNTVSEGDFIAVTYGKETYRIYIDDISQNEYVLRLGQVRLKKTIEQFTPGGVERTHSQ